MSSALRLIRNVQNDSSWPDNETEADRMAQLLVYPSHVEYEAILKHLDIGVVMVDRLDQVRIVNPIAMKLLRTSCGVGATVKEMSASSRTDIEQILKRARLRYPSGYHEHVVSNRPQFVYEITVRPIHHADGVRTGDLLLIRDITKPWAESRERSEFLSIVTHELFNPLTPVREALALLLDESIGSVNSEQRQCLEVVYEETTRLSRLVSDLLEINRLDGGQARLHREMIDVHRLVRSVLESLEKRARTKSITLCEDIPSAIDQLYADSDRMRQVLFNLVDNAVKYSPQGTHVEVSALARLGGIEISVKDCGFGMMKSDLRKLFRRFSQLDYPDHVRNRDKGSGLGLSIVQEIVRLHHGRVRVHSEFGRGSTFTIVLPKRRKARQHAGS